MISKILVLIVPVSCHFLPFDFSTGDKLQSDTLFLAVLDPQGFKDWLALAHYSVFLRQDKMTIGALKCGRCMMP